MVHPLMPKATAVWLVDNTTLTFDQVSEFCGLHALEVQAIADGEVATGMQGLDPIIGGELTRDEIARCEADTGATMQISVSSSVPPAKPRKGARYTPVSKRQDRPNAISWLVKNYPELSNPQVCKLIGTTKPTITAIRERTHWNSSNIKPMNPVGLGLCTGNDLEKAVAIARAKSGTVHVPGAATAPDGVHPKDAIQPDGELVDAGYGSEARNRIAPLDASVAFGDAPEPEKEEEPDEPTAESVFGPTPTDDEAAKAND